MFEGLVTGVLTNVMGSFIDPKCFSSDKISVAVWSGYVVLRNLEIKPEVIAHPSIKLVRGVVGSVELKIPWNRLQSESVVLTIDDVYLLVRTEEDIEGVLMEMDEFTIKKQLLEQLYQEAKKKQEAEQPATKNSDDGFAARLVNKIIDNIELHIRRIHVRLEDTTTGDHPFAVGLTVESVHAQSTNSNWHPSYVDSTKSNEPRIYKMIELNHLSVYLDPHCEVLRNQQTDFTKCAIEEFCHAFNHSIPKRFDDRHQLQLYPTHQRHHFILKPVDASARLIVNRDPFDTSIPKFEIDISVAEVALRLEESQYCDLLYLASAFQVPEHFKKYQHFRKFRPRQPIFEAATHEWWKYAIEAIQDENRKKKQRWSWKYIKQRRDDRIRYMRLWQRRVRRLELELARSNLRSESDGEDSATHEVSSAGSRSHGRSKDGDDHHSDRSGKHSGDRRAQNDVAALEAIERARSVEDILFFRYLADKQLEEQAKDGGATNGSFVRSPGEVPMPPFSDSESVDSESSEKNLPAELQYRSWGKWMFGWTSAVGATPSTNSSADPGAPTKREFSEIELRELFKIVEYEPAKKAKRQARPRDEAFSEDESGGSDLVSRITLSLGKGSITLASDPDTNKRLMRDDPNYGSRYAPTDFLLSSFSHLQVAAISQGDSTKIDVSLQAIEAFDESADSMAFSRLLARKTERSGTAADDDGGLMSAARMVGPIFLLSYETNPTGIAADAALFVHLEPLEIVFSPTARCWGRLGSFVHTPQVLGLWAELEVASFNDIVNLKARTEAKLNYVMANRVSLSVDLRIQAPLIVIPESDSDLGCARMVIDLGLINFRTEKLSKLDSDTSVVGSSVGSLAGGGLNSSSSLMLVNPTSSPMLTSSMSFVKQLYDDAEKGEGAIRWKEEFYDKFALSITNVHVLLIPRGKSSIPHGARQLPKHGPAVPSVSKSQTSEWELVERFSINVTLRTSVLPLDATLTRLYVHADLPALTFNMSLDKYFQLVALADRFGSSPSAPASSTLREYEKRFNPVSMEYNPWDEEERLASAKSQNYLSSSVLKKFLSDDTIGGDGATKMKLDDLTGHDDGSDAVSDADSDDTWFSITSGTVGDAPRSRLDGLMGDLGTPDMEPFSLDPTRVSSVPAATPRRGGAVSLPSPPVKPRLRRRGSMTLASGEVIDRRLLVCTFTIPVIAIQLKKPQSASSNMAPASFRYDTSSIFDDEVADSGTLLIKLEGFRVRIAKKTLSAQVDLCLKSLEVEDFIEAGGRASEYVIFSCPMIDMPYDLQAPPRRSTLYPKSTSNPRRRVSRRVVSVNRVGSGTSAGSSQTQSSQHSANLLELVFASSSDRRTGDEVSRDVDVRLGTVHVVFDQTYICSVLELFDETWSKISATPAAVIAEDDGDDDFLDAIPPPLDLESSVSQEYSFPMMLNESVLADLERARKQLLTDDGGDLENERESSQLGTTPKPMVAFSIGVQLQSVSVLFSDRSDPIASIAMTGTKLQITGGADDRAVHIRGVVADVRMFDLLSARDDVSIQPRPDLSHDGRKRYLEIFGLDQPHAARSNLFTLDVMICKSGVLPGTGQSSSPLVTHTTVGIRIEPVQLLIQSSFIEGLLNYGVNGALAGYFLARAMRSADESPEKSARRRRRSESIVLEGTADRVAASPDVASGGSRRLSGGASPFFDAMDGPSSKNRLIKSPPLRPSFVSPTSKPANSNPDSIASDSAGTNVVVFSVELVHPSIVVPCGKFYSPLEEAVVIDLGNIKIERKAATSEDADAPQVTVSVDQLQLHTRSDHMKLLEETSISVALSTRGGTKHAKVSASPVTVNVGERYICLAIDLWNDAVEPILQVVESVLRSPFVKLITAAQAEKQKSVTEGAASESTGSSELIVQASVEALRVVMVAKAENDFESWLKNTMDPLDTKSDRESYVAPSPGSPRKRRHLYSFASHDENGVFRSATLSPSVISVAELVLAQVTGSVCVGATGTDDQRIVGKVAIHEVLVRDCVGDASEHMCDVVSRISSSENPRSIAPQLTVDVSVTDSRGGGNRVRAVSCEVVGTSARVSILPRTLLRMEHFVVSVVVGVLKKLSQQDPRIVAAVMDPDESTMMLADTTGGGSVNGDFGASQERLFGYSAAHASRTRKNSMAESVKEVSSAPRAKAGTPDVALEARDVIRTSLSVRAELAQLEVWVLSSDKRRDSSGICLSSRLLVTIERSQLGQTESPGSDVPIRVASACISDVHLRLGSPSDVLHRAHGVYASRAQSIELVEPFTIECTLTARDFKTGSLPVVEVETSGRGEVPVQVPSAWSSWQQLESRVIVSGVSSRLTYKDLPAILRVAAALSSMVEMEERVRAPLATLSTQTDPYLELAAIDEQGDEDSFYHHEAVARSVEVPNRVVVVDVELGAITFRLVNNLMDDGSPVLGCRIGPVRISMKDETGGMTTVEASCSLDAWYHNLRLMVSEPLMEPWTFVVRCSQDNAIRHLRADPTDEDELASAPWKVTISSDEFLQWNVTDALITNVLAATRAWDWLKRDHGNAIDASDRTQYSTYWIRNETGLTLRYWGPSCQESVLNAGQEEPLTFSTQSSAAFDEGIADDSERLHLASRQLYVAVEDLEDTTGRSSEPEESRDRRRRRWESEFAIPVDQADSRMFALVDLDGHGLGSGGVRKCECVIDVLVERGCKVFVVRSTLVLENNTSSQLEVEYVPPFRRMGSPARSSTPPHRQLVASWKGVVGASSSIPVPINLVSTMDGYLMVRPPDMKSSGDGVVMHLPKAYAKKRVHLPLFDRGFSSTDATSSSDMSPEGEPQCAIRFHRLYGDRPVRPFMMSATLTFAKHSLYQRKVLFQPPLVLHNLTAGPLEYTIATPKDWMPATDGVNNPSTSVNLGWEDCQQRLRERGTINVADSLVWHLCDWDTPLELRVRIKGFEWSEPLRIFQDMAEDIHRLRLSDLSSSAQLFVSAETHTIKGRSREVFLFVPYWIVNLTGLKLEYEHDDEKAAYEHPTMLLAGQKRLDRDELLLKEELTRASKRTLHSHLIHPIAHQAPTIVEEDPDASVRSESDDRRRRHPGLIPSVPPIKGLLDLLPKPVEDLRAVGQIEVLQACHSSSQPERGCIRLRVNELDRRLGARMSDSMQKKWTESIVLDQPGTSGEVEAVDLGLDRVYSIGYSIATAKGRYSRTKVIMLTPRFMVINTMDVTVEVCHSSARSAPGIDDQGPGGSVVSVLNPALHLEPGGYADFHWSLPFARSKTIRCRLADPGWAWSGAVPLGDSREYVVRLRNESTRATKLIRVVLKQDSSCVCVYLREESSNAPPYRVENYSLETFRVHQHRVRRSEILLPHHSLDYAWDEPTQERVLVVDMLPSAAGDNSRPLRIGSFTLDKIHRFPDALGGTLGIEITADGPTRVLRFTDTRIRAAGTIDATGNVKAADEREGGAITAFPGKFLATPSFELALRLRGVGISIVDGVPRELVYVSLAGLSLELYLSDNNDTSARAPSGGGGLARMAQDSRPTILAMRFQMREFQIDNQLPVTPYPVLLRFSNPNARTRVIDGNAVAVPVVEINLVRHDGYAGVEFIRHFSLHVLPLHMRVDGSLLYQLLPVFMPSKVSKTGREPAWTSASFNQATLLLEEYNASLEVGVDILDVMREDGVTSVLASSSAPTDRDTVHSSHSDFDGMRRASFTVGAHPNHHHGKLVSKAEAKKLYFEEFQIDPIRATVSFSFGASAGAMVDGLSAWTDGTRHSSITVGPLRLIINAIGTSLAKIANAPFHLKAITIGHSFIQPDALASRLASHYQSEALRQAYVILGSVDVLGNPMVAWRNLRSGFQDFINEPVHGIAKSPTEFALGMGRGTYSLVRASVYTFLDFYARILAASSLGLSEACLKLDEYTGYPATRNIYQGFAQGISGIVVSPIRAVELNGVRGVVPGVFAGVFGFVLKPLLGLSLATATTVASLRDAIDPNTKALLMRARPPRHIDVRTRRLKVYSYVESFGEEMVGKLRGGRYRTDGYLGHVDLRQKCLVVTRKRILYVDVKAGQKYEVEWEMLADEMVLVDWRPAASGDESGALLLYFAEEDYTPRRRSALAAKGMLLSRRVVPLPDNRVLFVRAMLQQQDHTLSVEAQPVSPSAVVHRSQSMNRALASHRNFPSEYPIFHLPAVPTLTSSRSMTNLHTQFTGPPQHPPQLDATLPLAGGTDSAVIEEVGATHVEDERHGVADELHD